MILVWSADQGSISASHEPVSPAGNKAPWLYDHGRLRSEEGQKAETLQNTNVTPHTWAAQRSEHLKNLILFDFFSVILTGLPDPPALLSVYKKKVDGEEM